MGVHKPMTLYTLADEVPLTGLLFASGLGMPLCKHLQPDTASKFEAAHMAV